MASISLCMIVKDEEQTLARCLESAQGIADEIIVADTGSADRTREIAARYGRVVDFAWRDDFAAARNFSFAQAAGDFILWLDADDVIPLGERARFLALKARLDEKTDMVMLPYRTAFDEAGRPAFVYYRERIVRRRAGFVWQGAVHECITPRGNVVYGDAAVEHRRIKPADGGRNLRIYEKQLAAGAALDARGQFYYARELAAHGRHEQAAAAFRVFLARPDGWLENRIEAARGLAASLAALGRGEDAVQALLASFAWGAPRPESCCALAALLLTQGKAAAAEFWYRTAFIAPENARSGGFVQPQYRDFVPYLGLCQCCDRLGRPAEAEAWNERAAALRPESEAVRHNRAYFSRRRSDRGGAADIE